MCLVFLLFFVRFTFTALCFWNFICLWILFQEVHIVELLIHLVLLSACFVLMMALLFLLGICLSLLVAACHLLAAFV